MKVDNDDFLEISFPHHGRQFSDRLWQAVFVKSQEAWDYGSKNYLIAEAKKHGLKYQCIKRKRNGKSEIIESNF